MLDYGGASGPVDELACRCNVDTGTWLSLPASGQGFGSSATRRHGATYCRSVLLAAPRLEWSLRPIQPIVLRCEH
jgi:hypothetical protein